MNRKNDSRLHVVFASDENFVLPLEVAAKSLIKSCAGSEVVVDILDCEITNQTWEDLSSRLSAYAKMCGTELGVCRHLDELLLMNYCINYTEKRSDSQCREPLERVPFRPEVRTPIGPLFRHIEGHTRDNDGLDPHHWTAAV